MSNSSIWSTLQNVPSSQHVGGGSQHTSERTANNAESLLNTQLAAALSTMGDAQFFEESISPSTIRAQLSNLEHPSNPNSPDLLRGMKWLLACMSKGRDVSDFFSLVVKLVSTPSLEVRKMVYMYLVHYADHDTSCRELALLSINSFQRGLADSEQLIRALALRVLSSIRVSDILQIQVLAVQKCVRDKSPYVRKCAATALAKLSPSCTSVQRQILLEIMVHMLNDDSSTMVLTSTVITFCEICPDRLELLHGAYRKICHLLTDMDEWGQVVVIDTLARYCRRFFRHPTTEGSAEVIDRQRRVKRTLGGIKSSVLGDVGGALDAFLLTSKKGAEERSGDGSDNKYRRRVVRKAFYSDEEDESSEELIHGNNHNSSFVPVDVAMRQRNVLGFGTGVAGVDGNFGPDGAGGVAAAGGALDEDDNLDEDHRLLLRSSLPLLKSRNSGVVLAVCSLHYYCGVASIKIRSALGKSLVRIYRDRREIQYVVLTSIKTLVSDCPSAFTPFLNDFFVKAMDPSFTRMIKLDILTSLALEPNSINAVLKELRTYIRHDDKAFVQASIRAVGRIAELSRIVYDRQGHKTGNLAAARRDSNTIALNCLYGLMILTECSDYEVVVGECVVVMQRIILLLLSDAGLVEKGVLFSVEDQNCVQNMALRRLVLLVVRSLSTMGSGIEEGGKQDEDDDEDDAEVAELKKRAILLAPEKIAPALWIIGEWLTTESASSTNIALFNTDAGEKSQLKTELLRLVARFFADLSPAVKLHGIHFASKSLLSDSGSASGMGDATLCEYILALGRIDVNHEVRDRSRFESHVLQMTLGLQYDVENLPTIPPGNNNKITVQDAKTMLLRHKPSSSWLPIEDDHNLAGTAMDDAFRFGTLSSLVSHKAGKTYLPLPPWAEKDSPKSLRDPPTVARKTEPIQEVPKGKQLTSELKKQTKGTVISFYESDEELSFEQESSSPESSSDEDASDDDSRSSEEDSSEVSSSEEDSDVDDESDDSEIVPTLELTSSPTNGVDSSSKAGKKSLVRVEEVSDDDNNDLTSHASTSSNSDGSSASTESFLNISKPIGNEESLLDMGPNSAPPSLKTDPKHSNEDISVLSIADGLQGLVMAPLVANKEENVNNTEVDSESSVWKQMVRPELSGGLSVKVRYLRGGTREREVKLLGLNPDNMGVVCVQLKFDNRRTDSGMLRRIRLIQRHSNASGSISTTRVVVVPQEIGLLKKDQTSVAIMGLEFSQISDKDGALLARFEVKSDRGLTPIELRPPLGELLQTYTTNPTDFDLAVSRLHGIHQRTVHSFTLAAKKEGSTLKQLCDNLPQKIRKLAYLTPVDSWKGGAFRFVGALPASGSEVYVTLKCDAQTGAGEIMICCTNTMALNSLMEVLKRAVIGK